MTPRKWAYLASIAGLFIFGVLILGLGYVGYWLIPSGVSHTAEHPPSEYVNAYLAVGVMGTAVSLGILGRLALTDKKNRGLQG